MKTFYSMKSVSIAGFYHIVDKQSSPIENTKNYKVLQKNPFEFLRIILYSVRHSPFTIISSYFYYATKLQNEAKAILIRMLH